MTNKEIDDSNDFKSVIDTPGGRRFIRRLLDQCGVHQSSFSDSAVKSAYLEGKRAVGILILDKLAEHKAEYIKIMIEEENDDR